MTSLLAFFAQIDWSDVAQAALDTLTMLAWSLGWTVLLGLPLGIVLYLTGEPRLLYAPRLYRLLSLCVNVLRPERHQIQRLGVIGVDRKHLLQGLHRQFVMGFLMPVVGLGEQRLQRRVVPRRQRAARGSESQRAGEAERGEPTGGFHRYYYLSFHWLSPEPRRLRA